jgi:hypothetical protein
MNLTDEQISGWVDQERSKFLFLPKDAKKATQVLDRIKKQFIDSFQQICSHYDTLIQSPSYLQGCRLNPLPPNAVFYELNIRLYLATLRMMAKTEKDVHFLMPPVIHILLMPNHRAIECLVTPCDRPPADGDSEEDWNESEPMRIQAFNLMCTKLLQPSVPRQLISNTRGPLLPFERGYRSLGLSRYINKRNWFMSYVEDMQGSGSLATVLSPPNEIASYLSDGQRQVQKGRSKYNPDRFDQEPYPDLFGNPSVQMKPISHYMTMRGFVIIGLDNADDISWLEFQRYYNLVQNGVAPSNDIEDVKAVDFERLNQLDGKFETDGDQFLNLDRRQINRVVLRSDIHENDMK